MHRANSEGRDLGSNPYSCSQLNWRISLQLFEVNYENFLFKIILYLR